MNLLAAASPSTRSKPPIAAKMEAFTSSARPTLVSEDLYVVGRVLRGSSRTDRALSVRRTRVSRTDPETALTWGGAAAHVARLNLIALPANEVQQGRQVIKLPPRPAMETSFRNVHEPCAWTMAHPVDQIAFDLPQEAIADWAEDHSVAGAMLPETMSGSSLADPVLKAFGLAVLPVLDKEIIDMQFFLDHVLDGVCAYILKSFGSRPRSQGGLAPWQVRRAKEMLDSTNPSVALADVAAACGLSVAHFSRAFRQSCDMSPYKWLLSRKVERASILLRTTDTPLASIALDCGFADQAHLTNVVSKHFGSPPGALRRFWRGHATPLMS